MNWIHHPTVLTGQAVKLVPLSILHFDELLQLGENTRIWQHYIMDNSKRATLQQQLELALVERDRGNQYPFSIISLEHNRIIGSTRLYDIQALHRKLEIGWTWLHPDYWATAINPECKLLLLTYCFEELKAKRVQLKTDINNIRSRKAIEKIGGKYEGIVRHDLLRENGTMRDSAMYSILDTEWPEVKPSLTNLLTNQLAAQ